MQIITLAECVATPWRNGGGLTRALGSGHAPGSTPHPDGFDWRISLAEIAADGPFSTFPGIDRHALLMGNGAVELSGPSAAVMARPLLPISFPGELELGARRQPGTVQPRFLNLMVRRSALRGEIRIVTRRCGINDAVAWALVPLTGAWQLSGRPLEPGQAALGHGSDLDLAPHAVDARAALILVRPLP
ncbi:HutD family protein [Herbaspirillum sp. alder98]|uniref:HutD/Ves family protein n=1 Tax=Herbaspirillum sp. alder98 TaxID=2913096 RepID=UPI001CD84586|nr:HutD family protein [Herbaspirillum sp. alder98]MCA1326264.1 HutD family protein [Herbaspirillum sp. alder98]